MGAAEVFEDLHYVWRRVYCVFIYLNPCNARLSTKTRDELKQSVL